MEISFVSYFDTNLRTIFDITKNEHLFVKGNPLIFHDFEDEVDVAEVTGEVGGGVDVLAAELAAPDDIVFGVDGDADFKTETFGIDFNHGVAVPFGDGAAVIFRNQKGAHRELVGPFGDQQGVEVQFFADILSLDGHHEVCDAGLVELHFRFGGRLEIFYLANLDEKFRPAGKPIVEVAFGREFLEQ